ncbi:hypothetical protein B0A58_00955 [Flavobacterium branchiophilum NBRC 15030 = ATCC 35035]|uniref:Uncharacterized protein DUF4249 n=1 Tax=Flavobacterium branchiophilum TaxID=55197 RepID=A0A543G886_9FLAO|nr:DUF4249 domain-containing protein [Flavobacterium branchiophilum]OXA81926.1 hypothetical protein B0A58_00955 [Flavobacterium branchiophilum NBRC 15030 = ATCC 35035]TQM42295.1 uncharacterized protein DUF4249 [Flavobacterium branchiophilum]
MKKIFLKTSILFSLFWLIGCQDVVDVKLDTATPKLVVDAVIKWQKGTSGATQMIKLSTTNDYYSNIVPVVSGATVYITTSNGTTFNFIETNANTGVYICNNFAPIINQNYQLHILYKGETYSASDRLMAAPSFNTNVEQIEVPGFGGTNVIQVKCFFQDNPLENNYYLTGVKQDIKVTTDYRAIDDKFFQGNQMFRFYTDKDLKTGSILQYSLQGISLEYYNYMNKLIEVSGSSGGSPFSTPPATLRGNITNQTNESNYPLGYFALGETDNLTYTVQ